MRIFLCGLTNAKHVKPILCFQIYRHNKIATTTMPKATKSCQPGYLFVMGKVGTHTNF